MSNYLSQSNFMIKIRKLFEKMKIILVQRIFLTGQRENHFSSTGKNSYRDFFVQNQSLQYRRRIPIGIFFVQTQSL